MIKYLKRDKIDVDKYNACIENSKQSRIYAYSWYLDIVADSWGVLVLDDYKAVMPIPFMRAKKNFFFKKILQPQFCQQLGIYSEEKLHKDLYNNFLIFFKKLKPKLYNFNSDNTFLLQNFKINLTSKVNYELNLKDSYQNIFNSFNPKTKKDIKKAQSSLLNLLEDISLQDLIELQQQNRKYKLSKKVKKQILELYNTCMKKNMCKIIGVTYENKLIAGAFFLVSSNRIIYLFSVSSNVGYKKRAMFLIISNIIKMYATKNLILDFEGSMIKSIAHFFKGFGSSKTIYLSFKG